ncbi:MAG TPA: alkaline phosphatase family protein [Fimbriiglobus sp.]|nr:alkaline phosphatase family protein [Fimbriiglobus sp.]
MSRLLLGLTALSLSAPLAVAGPPKVKLAVVAFFDQMRGDYVERWRPLFGEGGFKRLQTEGAWFADCHYPHGITTTGPGHASVLAGCSGDRHGIFSNNWYDRATGKTLYCAASDRYRIVPPVPTSAPAEAPLDAKRRKQPDGGNPDRLLAPTLADAFKDAVGSRGKVFGVSLKDRSAIFPSGHKSDGAYWFDGRFVTSTYYRDALPAWVDAFNKSGKAESYFGKDWTRFRTDLDYAKFSGPDDGPGEGTGKAQGKTFPHPTTGGKDKIGKTYYEAMATSPYGNELLLTFAKACIEAEKLGQDDVPDLLTVSFSSNDLIGHAWGPDSQEVLDVTLRSDALIADFLAYLDAKVGKGNYSFVVTADHGACPNPEVSAAKGLDARRVSPSKLLLGAERVLRDAYGAPAGGKKDRSLWIEAVVAPYVYLNHRLLRANGIDPDDAAAKLADWARHQDGVYRVYTAKQLRGDAGGDAVLAAMRKSYYADRAGDLVVVLKPYYLLSTYVTGTSHGTPHEYDTHVPLLVYGPGVPGGRRTEKVAPQQACPIVADFLGVAPPKTCEYGLPATLAK